MQTAEVTQSTLDPKVVGELILDVAREYTAKGPGWAQESVVLREVAERLGVAGDVNVSRQQTVLTCWHDLFRDGVLSWGYDIDNPSAPCFHFRETGLGSGA